MVEDHLLNDAIGLLLELKLHLQEKPEMLVNLNKIDGIIKILETNKNEYQNNKYLKDSLLILLAGIFKSLPSIINLISKFI